jgi:hypothetical protein
VKSIIQIEVDTDAIQSVTDSYLATLWNVAQANPSDPFEDRDAGCLVELIGREIIARFLRRTPPELWRHHGGHFDWGKLHLNKQPEAM